MTDTEILDFMHNNNVEIVQYKNNEWYDEEGNVVYLRCQAIAKGTSGPPSATVRQAVENLANIFNDE